MAQQKIQLRKIRDFGENFSDTFQFIRQEFKPLLTVVTLIAGIFLLVNAIFAGIFNQQALGIFSSLIRGVTYSDNVKYFSFFSGAYFLVLLLNLLTLSAMRTIIGVYMLYYDEHGTSPTVQQVWSGFVRNIFQIFIFSIVRFVFIIIGYVMCVAPGVYLTVVLMPFSFIIINENTSFGDTFTRCFDLIKENFWISLAIYLVAMLIFSFSSGIIGFVIGIITEALSYFTTKEINTGLPIVGAILNLIEYFFYIIFFISAGFQYYTLVEIRDGTGLSRRLEDLGGNVHPNKDIEEQF
jgi:hypothetical protein